MKAYSYTDGIYAIYCEGCKQPHTIPTQGIGTKWGFNGDVNTPTFTPSVKLTYGKPAGPDMPVNPYCCHFNITNGQIIFHGDCTHELKGQTLPLKEYPPEWMHE